ncbi:MAG: hypothetical protein REI78_03220 [Pedobacter sp.]|nr:hypothetical protein [Pedobacter sp.]
MRKTIDYQYQRTETTYHAYAAFQNSLLDKNSVELDLVSTFKLSDLQGIKLRSGDDVFQLAFKKITAPTAKNDEKRAKLYLSVDLKEIWQSKLSCDAVITFTLLNKQTISLPFNYCLIKTALTGN